MRSSNRLLLLAAFLALVVPQRAPAQYLTDGTKPVSGGVNTPGATTYSNPKDGVCVVGVKPDGTLTVDKTVTNAQDCNAYTTGLTSMTSQAMCVTAGSAGNDGYRHKWSGTNKVCVKAGAVISRKNLDVTDNMCTALGGTIVTTGVCTAYGWTYMNSTSGEAVPYRSTIDTLGYEGRTDSDKLGFCYATMRMTTAFTGGMTLPADATTCPAINNNGIVSPGGGLSVTASTTAGSPVVTLTNGAASTSIAKDWWVTIAGASTGGAPYTAQVLSVAAGPVLTLTSNVPNTVTLAGITAYAIKADWPLGSDEFPYQTPASYDKGLGWGWTGTQCTYTYGRNGYANAAITRVDGTTLAAAGAAANMAAFTTQGDCLANGGSWDAWLPYDQANLTTPGATTTTVATTPSSTTVVKLDATTPVLSPGGGDFYTGTGSVCQKCHSDQSRSYMERYKPGYVLTGHKLAGDDPAFQAAIGAEWGVKGVQCTTCHATGKPALQDKGLVVYPNTTGANAGLPRAATGHTQLDLGSHVTGICYKCHGTPTVPDTLNPAVGIPTSGGEFTKTAYNLAPLVNQFLASSHAKYSGANAKGRTVDVITKSNYGSTFVGYVCKVVNGSAVLTSWVDKGVPARIPNLDSATNIYCTGSSTPQADGTAYAGGAWARDGEAAGTSNGVPFEASDQGNCMTCHDVHWSMKDHNTYDGLHPEPFRRECTTCHVNASSTTASKAPQINLSAINHSAAAGTPLVGTPDAACESCHMPKLTSGGSFLHLWSISTNAAYTTAGASTANADTDGTIKVDLDAACGQCHGGGMNAVANPPKPGIPYYTRAALAVVAKGMHASAGNNYQVTFSNVVSGLSVTPTASVNCGAGVTCPAFTYDWSWGDGTTTLAQPTVTPAPHVYAAAGSFSITLTVKLVSNGLSVGSVTRTVNLTSADAPPTAAGTFTWDANSWTATLVDASIDDKTLPADLAVVVEWGDGTRSAGRANGTFSHVYLKPPPAPATSYAITQSVVDTKPQKTTRTYGPVIPAYFTIGGTVTARLGAALSGATVLVRRGSVYSRTLTTDGAGAFTVGNLVPGVYTLKVTKFGYTFINPIAIPAIGPSNTTVGVAASAP